MAKSSAGGTPSRRRAIVLALGLTLAVAAIACASASAVYKRPYLSRLNGTFVEPTGVAIDAPGNIWVSDLAGDKIDEFDSAGNLKGEILDTGHFPEGGPETVAVANPETGPLYVTGNEGINGTRYVDQFNETGLFLERLGPFFGQVHAAVDRSAGEHAGDVYVAETGSGTVKLLTPSGAPVDFSGDGTEGYIRGNELTGPTASEPWSASSYAPASVAADSQGNIYVVDRGRSGGGMVDEFAPSGVLIRVFTGREDTKSAPSMAGAARFGESIEAVAIDASPTNGHVVIGENNSTIYEFEADGHYLGQVANNPSEVAVRSAHGLALSSSGDLYVADPVSRVVDIFGPGALLPDLTLAPASSRTPMSATLSGSIDPEGIPVSDCHFEYVTEAAFEDTGFASPTNAPCEDPVAGEIPSDFKEHEVHARLTGLVSGTTYRYRLTATSDPTDGGGTNESIDTTFTAPHAPSVDATSSANVSSTFIALRAEINPLGADTTYQFQYIPAAAYQPAASDPYSGGGTAPSAPLDIGAGGSDASVLQEIGGLAPDTTYDFRVVASNALGTTPGANLTFTTLAAGIAGLGDGRGYELLTPPNKGDAEDMFGAASHQNFDVGYAAEDGDGFLLFTSAAFGPYPASGENGYVFSRGESGWSYQALAVPGLGVQSLGGILPEMSSFSRVAIHDNVGTGGKEDTLREENELGPAGGPYTTLSANAYSGGGNTVVGASSDLATVALATRCQEREGAGCYSGQDAETDGLEEWRSGALHPVNVTSTGAPLSRCGVVLGQEDGVSGATRNAVSADGSKIFFTVPDPHGSGTGCWTGGSVNPPELYMRLGGTKTVELSTPAAGVNESHGQQPAVYVGAAADGSKVFFMSESELTKDDEGIAGPELYEYDTETGVLTRVSRGEKGNAAGNVRNVPAISADGSAVYFTSASALTSNAPSVSGDEVNLYRYDTGTEVTTYVATVEGADYPSDVADRWWNFASGKEEVGLDAAANWYTTPDGRYLVFASRRDLTGYDTTAASFVDCPGVDGAGSNGHCTEVYRYDSVQRSLLCVSCDPSGTPPTSNALFARSAVRSDSPGGPPRPISNDGSYVFFDTADALVPQDTNEALDVYEWHAGGVSLISSGADSSDSFFLDSSPDGSNVFFGTHAQLVLRDTDSEGDLYDARIGGGEGGVSGSGPCEGDACQAPAAAPNDLTPASLTFTAPLASGAGAPMKKATTSPETRSAARARALAKALRLCKQGPRKKRGSCEARARRRYGASVKTGKAKVGRARRRREVAKADARSIQRHA